MSWFLFESFLISIVNKLINVFNSPSSSFLSKGKNTEKYIQIFNNKKNLLENVDRYYLILQILYENFEKQAIEQLVLFHLKCKSVVQDLLILLILVLKKNISEY